MKTILEMYVLWKQLIVPESLRREVLQQLSLWWSPRSGKMYRATGEAISLARVCSERTQLVSSMCYMCCLEDRGTKELGSTANYVAVDIVGPLPESEAGHLYIF